MPKKSNSPKIKYPAAIAMLIADHRKVQKLFKRFEKLDPSEDETRDLIELTCLELTAHARLEEELFYPALRGQIDEPELLDEAQVEHDVAKNLIEQLRKLKSSDPAYAASFIVLGEYIGHHIEEEETEMFKKAKRTDIDFDDLALEMREQKHKIMQELGLEEEVVDSDDHHRKSPRRPRIGA